MRLFFSLILLLVPATSFSLNNDFEEGKLIAILDGDTIIVDIRGAYEKVRLIGIDSPETHVNDKAYRDSNRSHQSLTTITKHGKQSEAYLKKLIPKGSILKLEYDVEKRDKYYRLLAYVYLKDGTMINEKLVRDGYANLLTFPPNIHYVKRLKQAEKDARDTKAGLWANE